jgi:hypothetical protein
MNTAPLDLPLAFDFDEESVLAQTAKLLGLKAVDLIGVLSFSVQ